MTHSKMIRLVLFICFSTFFTRSHAQIEEQICHCLDSVLVSIKEAKLNNYELEGPDALVIQNSWLSPCDDFEVSGADYKKALMNCASYTEYTTEVNLFITGLQSASENTEYDEHEGHDDHAPGAHEVLDEDEVYYDEEGGYQAPDYMDEINLEKGNEKKEYKLVTIEEQEYRSCKIGEQEWMADNLNVSKFRNGDEILEAKSISEWIKADELGQAVWSYYKFNPKYEKTYGKLYNWHAVVDYRGLEPEGWFIPNSTDWDTLINFLGGEELAGAEMKYPVGWNPSEGVRNLNSSGFSGLAAGRYSHGAAGFKEFDLMNEYGSWWSSSLDRHGDYAIHVVLDSEENSVRKSSTYTASGLSVRCIKGGRFENKTDPLAEKAPSKKQITIVDKSSYKSTKIGKEHWMAENLNTSVFQNGDSIPQANTMWEWEQAKENKTPAWCYADFKAENGLKQGKLYNSYAVLDPRGLAPEGWHIPDMNDLETLERVLGGEEKAANKLRNTEGWDDSNGSNSSGFSAIPVGLRGWDGEFYYGYEWLSTSWWCIEDRNREELEVGSYSIDENSFGYGSEGGMVDHWGKSVRCIKD